MKSLGYLLGLAVFQLLATFQFVRSSPIVGGFNKEILVGLRIEGSSQTLFEGPIITDGHNVTTSSGGTHHCDGTNNGENVFPSATATSALDDAAHKGRFTWDGEFFPEFDDFLVSRIGKDQQTQDKSWLLVVNFQTAQVGGCQQNVSQHDDVLWAFGDFNNILLKLTGPKTARKGYPFTVTVTDGKTGRPMADARVAGMTTGSDGKASLIFTQSGSQHLKAERSQSIRSNTLEVEVGP